MRQLRTTELGAFPVPAALSLIVLIPCAAMIQMVGEITGPGMAIACLAVGTLGVYSVEMLFAWTGMFIAERAIGALGRMAAGRAPQASVAVEEIAAT